MPDGYYPFPPRSAGPWSELIKPNGSAGPFPVRFPLFDNTGANLHVFVDGVSVRNWTLTCTPHPYTSLFINGSITFLAPVTGAMLEIYSAFHHPAPY